jgi:hypothetical protein
MELNKGAEDEVLCRGVGCPHKNLFIPFAAAGGESKNIQQLSN